DTVFIVDRKFIPMDNKFYEVLTSTVTPLLLEFTYKIDDPPVSVGYGNASPVITTTSLTSLVRSGSEQISNCRMILKLSRATPIGLKKMVKFKKPAALNS
ncbi:MAG: hypothetical protein ABIU77_07185, partial [Ferruginibacter sp.]